MCPVAWAWEAVPSVVATVISGLRNRKLIGQTFLSFFFFSLAHAIRDRETSGMAIRMKRDAKLSAIPAMRL